MEGAPHAIAYLLPRVRELVGPVGPSTRVLDVGCGNGFIAGQLLNDGCRVVGIDLNPTGIEIARRRYPAGRFEVLAAREGLVEALGEPSFDVVVTTEVVEHIYDPRSFARACYTALRPGGRLVCSTPYHGYLKNVLVAASNKFDRHVDPLWDDGHIKFWSRKTLSRLLVQSGFVDLQFRGAGRAPWLWMSMVMAGTRPNPS